MMVVRRRADVDVRRGGRCKAGQYRGYRRNRERGADSYQMATDAAWGEAPISRLRERQIAGRWKRRERQWKCRMTSRDKLEPNLPTLDDLERDSAARPQQETTLGPLDGVGKHGVRCLRLATSQTKLRVTRSAEPCVEFPEQLEHRRLRGDRYDIEPLDREPRGDRAAALTRASRGPGDELDCPVEPCVVRVIHYDAFQG
jgi:hypothetical protein